MVANVVQFDRQKLSDVCRRYQVRKLSLFGSILRSDFQEQSDIDVLVEFEPDAHPGLRYFALEQELSELVGRQVDLNTAGFLSADFRDEVLASAEVQYDAET